VAEKTFKQLFECNKYRLPDRSDRELVGLIKKSAQLRAYYFLKLKNAPTEIERTNIKNYLSWRDEFTDYLFAELLKDRAPRTWLDKLLNPFLSIYVRIIGPEKILKG
jgi:hypothetical protein